VIMFSAECWTIRKKMSKEFQQQRWVGLVKKITRVSRIDKHRNRYKKSTGTKENSIGNIQRSRLRWFGHEKHNGQVPFLALHTLLPSRS